MKKIFFITLSLLLSLIFLPTLIKANGLGGLETRICAIVSFIESDIVPAIGGFAMAVAGILFMFSGASPSLHAQAKQALIYIVIGIIIILGARELVSAVAGGVC